MPVSLNRRTRATIATALRAAALVLAKTKALRVFDFDDTLVSSHGEITVIKPNGEKVILDSATFAHFKPMAGDKIDFGAFNHVNKPRKIKKNFDVFKQAVARGDAVVILTARAHGARSAVSKFLDHEGVHGVHIVALASSNPYDKARWVDKAIADHGYTDVKFYDDSKANAAAVAEHGAKHVGVRVEALNTPHPREEDYDGPVLKKDFMSDDPTEAVVDYSPKADIPDHKGHGQSDWWKAQSKEFQRSYCKQHGHSRYCGGRS